MSDKSQIKNLKTWKPMLQAVLVRNTAAKELSSTMDGSVELQIPAKKPGWAVPPVSWVVRPPEFKILKLDPVGSHLWKLIDDRKTTEELIEIFARKHFLTFHESRVSVTTYVKMLVQRGALAVVIND